MCTLLLTPTAAALCFDFEVVHPHKEVGGSPRLSLVHGGRSWTVRYVHNNNM